MGIKKLITKTNNSIENSEIKKYFGFPLVGFVLKQSFLKR